MIVSQQLRTRITAYSLLAGAFICISKKSSSQVICNDFDPDIGVTVYNDEAYVDLNNNGIMDIKVTFEKSSGVISCSYCGGWTFSSARVWSGVSNTNTYALFGLGNFNEAQVLNFGDTIGPTISWGANPFSGVYLFDMENLWNQTFSYQDTIHGQWINLEDKYLPVLLEINYQDYYGWLRLSTGGYVAIKEGAFNSIADSIILAGQCGIATSNMVNLSDDSVRMSFYSRQLTIKIPDPKLLHGQLSAYNNTGQLLFTSKASALTSIFDFENYAAGLYYALYRVSNRVFVLKFVVQ
jgi:hypothetical protein